MIHSAVEFEADMVEILKAIRDKQDLDILSEKIGEANFNDAIAECIDECLTKGCHYSNCASGNVAVQYNNPRLSYAGLRFIDRK
jgi:hypothetical protein